MSDIFDNIWAHILILQKIFVKYNKFAWQHIRKIITRNLYCLKMQKQTQRRRSLHFDRTHDQNLEACCRGISFCQARDNPKQLLSHRHCYQYLNSAKLRFSDSRGTAAGCNLTINIVMMHNIIQYINLKKYSHKNLL